MRLFNRRRNSNSASSNPSTLVPPDITDKQLHRATRTRKIFAWLCSLFLFISVIFLILLEIGGTYKTSVIKNWYFLRLNVSNVIPASVPNAVLINTIAQTLGLHDFYQVGLWGFCEGYSGQGVTYCSPPHTLYWFNPVEILRNELLAGASINLPANINNILDLIKIVSQVMFGLFLTSACLSFVLIFCVPFSLYSRWLTLPIAILTFLNALFCTAASIIATVMFIIFRNVITGVAELNIGASIGRYMFAWMWVASAFAIFAWLIQTGLCCCCASRRDVKTGRKRGNEKAYAINGAEGGPLQGGANVDAREKPTRRRFPFGKRSV